MNWSLLWLVKLYAFFSDLCSVIVVRRVAVLEVVPQPKLVEQVGCRTVKLGRV